MSSVFVCTPTGCYIRAPSRALSGTCKYGLGYRNTLTLFHSSAYHRKALWPCSLYRHPIVVYWDTAAWTHLLCLNMMCGCRSALKKMPGNGVLQVGTRVPKYYMKNSSFFFLSIRVMTVIAETKKGSLAEMGGRSMMYRCKSLSGKVYVILKIISDKCVCVFMLIVSLACSLFSFLPWWSASSLFAFCLKLNTSNGGTYLCWCGRFHHSDACYKLQDDMLPQGTCSATARVLLLKLHSTEW